MANSTKQLSQETLELIDELQESYDLTEQRASRLHQTVWRRNI